MIAEKFFRQKFCRCAALVAMAAGCVTVHAENDSISVPAGFTGMLAGYLAPKALPEGLAMVPPVPAADL